MQGKTWFRRIGNELLDLVYPPGLYCICCGKIIDDSRPYRLCNECMKAMNWNTGRHCGRCGRPLADTDPGELCFGCLRREASGQMRSYDKGFICAGYGACAQSVIFALKYGGRADIGDTLGEIMFDYMLSEYEADELAGRYDLVMPVPIYEEKRQRRGYNHADLIASGFADRAGLRYEAGAVIRKRATLPMKGLGPAERSENIRGAFGIRPEKKALAEGAGILLIDDIFTTGATINEIAAVLKDAGAVRVDFLAFAAAADIIVS